MAQMITLAAHRSTHPPSSLLDAALLHALAGDAEDDELEEDEEDEDEDEEDEDEEVEEEDQDGEDAEDEDDDEDEDEDEEEEAGAEGGPGHFRRPNGHIGPAVLPSPTGRR